MNAILRIAWITIRELLYERVFYLLLSFAILSLGVSLLLGQMTYSENLKFILDFMLAGIQISMILFSVFMGISLFHRELHAGSIFMVLSKPISRASFIIGKFLGQIVVQMGVILAMGLLTLLICSQYQGSFSTMALTQTIFMIGLEASILAALTYLLAVNAGGVTSAVIVLCLFVLGHSQGTINSNITGSDSTTIWKFTKALIPNLEIFNMKAFASYGLTIAWNEVGLAFIYATCCITLYLLAAILCFNQKDIT